MSDYDELDEMTGSMSDWVSKKESAMNTLSRITPAKKDKVFEKRTTISPDPSNPVVAQIIELLNDKVYDGARDVANSTDAEAFLNEFIDEYIKNGPQKEGEWIFVREVQSGARGKTAPVKVELSYDKDGDLNVVDVPKSMIYAIDGRKWRGKLKSLIPQQPVESTPDPATSGESVVSEDNPSPASADENPVADSASNPASPADKAPPIPPPTEDDPLVALLGGKVVENLRKLGIRDNVKIASQNMKTFKVVDGASGPVKIIGDNGEEFEIGKGNVISGSMFGPIGSNGSTWNGFTPANMGDVLNRSFRERVEVMSQRDDREVRIEQLRQVRKHIDALSKVFGFDDPQQLEAFFAAWLMEESTCRLTGIPGTGKTTVINSAASLLANSYGFNVGRRYLASKPVSAGQEHEYILFPTGQDYDVNFSDKNSQDAYRAWEAWRFTEWRDGDHRPSGAYLYDFKFLQRYGSNGEEKIPMKPSRFAELLLATPITDENGLNTNMIKARPITAAELREEFGAQGLPGTITERQGQAFYGGDPLYNDSGANEGYAFREFLMEHFYDDRLDDDTEGFNDISAEMLNECGIAKIDYDKRAEEILYGIEIRQITDKQRVGGTEKEVAAYQFDPMPRKIVTQPVKFFNEANRSGSGVEDAILGLIAERTVEYRGQTFKSPKFVAWMDTNPHQKGNDLAFVDRIDMELYFGTLTLGGRFNTLVERYGGESKGSRPEFQLIQRMLKNRQDADFIEPLRFGGLKRVWKTVNGTPFTASGGGDTTSGALLDISLISVLFTQRFMIQGKDDKIWGQTHKFKNADDVYSSPLADISTTTNSQFESQHTNWLEAFGKEGTNFQAPVLITRMLGFRFSNSLIKMTRALAFLRGKNHVTRQEVIDALPYCVGHRLGPAREGEDPKGRDIGIVRDAMRVPNEQDFIKEMILNGYVLRNTESGLSSAYQGKPTLFEIWDSFLKNCSTHMNSTDAYWKYEEKILKNIKTTVRDNKGTGITPVHWSIATMVVDNVRKENKYKTRYSSYLERLSRPASLKGTKTTPEQEQIAQLLANTSASQYFRIRGDIAGDPFLFSDDRAKLLLLVDSKIEALCGRTLKATNKAINSNFSTVAPTYNADTGANPEYQMGEGKTFESFDTSIGGPSVSKFPWKCYGDGMGAWGEMVSLGANRQGAIADIGSTSEYLDVSGADYESNQNVAITANFIIPPKNESVVNEEFDAAIKSFITNFTPHTSSGVGIGTIDVGKRGKTEEYNDLAAYASKMTVFLNEYLSQNGADQAQVNAGMKEGFNACFRLKHIEQGVADSMKIIYNGKEYTVEGEDDLRLWLSLRVIQGNNTNVGGSATIGFFIGFTSACMRPLVDSAGKIITDANNQPTSWEVLPFNDSDAYNPNYYTGTAGSDNWESKMYQDIGNMTTSDFQVYTQKALKAIKKM